MAVPPRVLVIAGSDSGGGAGVQADIKTSSALGAFATTAVSCLTAQTTQRVAGAHVPPAHFVALQISEVARDIGCDAVKIGAVADGDSVRAVVRELAKMRWRDQREEQPQFDDDVDATTTTIWIKRATSGRVAVDDEPDEFVVGCPMADAVTMHVEQAFDDDVDDVSKHERPAIVVDPVMVTSSGSPLVTRDAVAAMMSELLPNATIVTPNIIEMATLLAHAIDDEHERARREAAIVAQLASGDIGALAHAARQLAEQCRLERGWVLLKGGHCDVSATGSISDVLFCARTRTSVVISGPRVETRNTHGTGCTLASAIAAGLAKGRSVPSAVLAARKYLTSVLYRSRSVHLGLGPFGPMVHAARSQAPLLEPAQAPRASLPAHERVRYSRVREQLRVYAVTEPSYNAKWQRSLAQAVEAAVRGGATMVQLRDKSADTSAFVALARDAIRAVRRATAELGLPHVPVLINDRVDVALAAEADGVHLGQSDLAVADARRLLGPTRIIGVTVGHERHVRAAVAGGADYLGTDSVYATSTKLDAAAPMGIEALARVCRAAFELGPVPVVAIGGISRARCAEVVRLGEVTTLPARHAPAGVAIVSAIFDQQDIEHATRAIATAVADAFQATNESVTPSATPIPTACQGRSSEPASIAITPLPTAMSSLQKVVSKYPFAVACHKASADAWHSATTHPFVVALADGSLDAERFRVYQMQDARFLECMADTMALLATRHPLPADKHLLLRFATDFLVVERQMHLEYGDRLAYTENDIRSLVLAPNVQAYCDFLLAAAHSGSVLYALAAATPCPFLYCEIGQWIAGLLHDTRRHSPPSSEQHEHDGATVAPLKLEKHPYGDWLLQYSHPDDLASLDSWLALLERTAQRSTPQEQQQAIAAFGTSVQFEWMFWEQAWRKQRWPIGRFMHQQ